MIIVRSRQPYQRALLWFHGFNADAETHRPELERFARAGIDSFGIDAVGHGSRRWPDLTQKVAAPAAEAKKTMLEIADATAREVPDLVGSLSSQGYERISVAGVSMGGYIVYRALLLEPRIHSAVAMLGSPEGLAFAAFEGRRLLSITAEHDENVPPVAARDLHRFLKNAKSHYLELPGVGHLMDGPSWDRAIEAVISWVSAP